MASTSPDLHPQAKRLLQEISILRESLALRLEEWHDLEHVVRPNLLALYQTKLGPWELQLLRAQAELARRKRAAELVQAALNRGETPDPWAITARLEQEFATWQQRLAEAAQKIQAAQFRLDHLLPAGDATALKQTYHALVKKLHPDVNPALTPVQQQLWLQVTEAYTAGDLAKLRTLSLLVAEEEPLLLAEENALARLEEEKQRLIKALHRLEQQLGTVREQPPFCFSSRWHDDAWLEQRRQEVEAQTAALHLQAEQWKTHLQAFQIIHDARTKPGLN